MFVLGNKLNIDESAAIILREATRSVDAILARRAELDRAGQPDKPLIVLAGESHEQPPHQLHLLGVLKGLKDKEPITVAEEFRHNLLIDTFKIVMKRLASPHKQRWLRTHDADGRLSQAAKIGFKKFGKIPFMVDMMSHFLLRHNIPSRLNDAAMLDKNLDPKDGSTVKSLRACFGHAVKEVNACDPAGMYIRNHHMVQQALDFAQEYKSRILIQHCGRSHVIGQKPHLPSEQSLAVLFKNAGLPVLAMQRVSADEVLEYIARGHKLMAQEYSIAVLPETERLSSILPSVYLPEEQAADTNSILEKMGLAADMMPWQQMQQSIQQHQEFLRETFAQCHRETGPLRILHALSACTMNEPGLS